MFHEKGQGGSEDVRRLRVPAEDEVDGIADPSAPQGREDLPVFPHLVHPFVHAGQGVAVYALDSQVDVEKAAPFRKVQEGRFPAQVRGKQARPADLQGDERLHQLHGMRGLAREVAVGEEDIPRPAAFDLLHHLLHGAVAVFVAQIKPLRAEPAPEGAPSGSLDGKGPHEAVPPVVEEIVAGKGEAPERVEAFGTVHLPKPSEQGVFQHPRPDGLALPDPHRIAVFGRFLGVEGGMGSAHDNWEVP